MVMNRFSVESRRALALAQEEAARLGHNYISVEHLLLGIVREEESTGWRVLRALGATLAQVAELVEQLTGSGRAIRTVQKFDLTPRLKQVIEFAVDEARKLGHSSIQPEHLLLGLIRQPDGVAAEIFERLGLAPEHIRRHTLAAIQQKPESVVAPLEQMRAPDEAKYARPREKLQRFTQPARMVMALAEEEARRLTHNYIGVEHLLLGLAREENGIAGHVLRELGLTHARISELIQDNKSARAAPERGLDLTPRTKQAIEYAVAEARKQNPANPGHSISTRHLLLGLLRHTDGPAIAALRALDLAPEQVRYVAMRVTTEE